MSFSELFSGIFNHKKGRSVDQQMLQQLRQRATLEDHTFTEPLVIPQAPQRDTSAIRDYHAAARLLAEAQQNELRNRIIPRADGDLPSRAPSTPEALSRVFSLRKRMDRVGEIVRASFQGEIANRAQSGDEDNHFTRTIHNGDETLTMDYNYNLQSVSLRYTTSGAGAARTIHVEKLSSNGFFKMNVAEVDENGIPQDSTRKMHEMSLTSRPHIHDETSSIISTLEQRIPALISLKGDGVR